MSRCGAHAPAARSRRMSRWSTSRIRNRWYTPPQATAGAIRAPSRSGNFARAFMLDDSAISPPDASPVNLPVYARLNMEIIAIHRRAFHRNSTQLSPYPHNVLKYGHGSLPLAHGVANLRTAVGRIRASALCRMYSRATGRSISATIHVSRTRGRASSRSLGVRLLEQDVMASARQRGLSRFDHSQEGRLGPGSRRWNASV